MTELIVNIIQLVLCGIYAGVALWRTNRTRRREWIFLLFVYIAFFLGDLHWLMYLAFYKATPAFSFVSDITWQAAYLFLIMLLSLRGGELKGYRCFPALTGPAFTMAMCLFYIRWGDYLGNFIVMVLMGFLLWESIRGLVFLRGKPEKETGDRYLYAATILFCLIEYIMWTLSCFWMGDTMANPYFWFDLLLSAGFFLFIPALERAVGR